MDTTSAREGLSKLKRASRKLPAGSEAERAFVSDNMEQISDIVVPVVQEGISTMQGVILNGTLNAQSLTDAAKVLQLMESFGLDADTAARVFKVVSRSRVESL